MTQPTPLSGQTIQPSNPMLSHAAVVKRLAVGVLLINLFVISLTGLTIYQSRLQHQKQAEITTQNLSRVLEEDIDGSIDKIDMALLSVQDEVRRQIAAGGIDARALNVFLAEQQDHHPEILSLRATDAEAVVRYGRGVPSAGGPKNTDREYFIRARDESQPGLIITKPVFTRIDKKWAVVLARRLSQPDGSFAGVVYVNIALEHLSRIFSGIDVGPHGVVTLRDRDLGLVARYPEPDNFNKVIGSKPSLEGQKQMQTVRDSGTFIARNPLDNVERMLSYHRISDKPFYISVGVAEDDYLAEWRKETIWRTAFMALFLLGTLLSSWLIYRSWKRQIVAAETLRESEGRFRTMADNAPVLIWMAGVDGLRQYFNKVWLEFTGRSMEQEIGNGWTEGLHPEDFQRYMDTYLTAFEARQELAMEYRLRRFDGEYRWLVSHSVPRYDDQGTFLGYIGSCVDITERHQMQEQVQQLAFYDTLTKLPNRRLLDDRLSQATAASARTGRYGAVMFLDLDNFKPLNDTHGHWVGDLLLVEAANRLKSCVREMDTVARFGGDEFVVILSELDVDEAESASEARIVAEKIRTILADPYLLTIKHEGKADTTIEHHCTASIGVALFFNHEAEQGTILKRADAAMYQAKDNGRNLIRFHDVNHPKKLS